MTTSNCRFLIRAATQEGRVKMRLEAGTSGNTALSSRPRIEMVLFGFMRLDRAAKANLPQVETGHKTR
ncbi:hypothetical protein A6U85_19860 [Agrobacterium sp. 13-626]|nr:hypothetical protein DXT98_17545 [Agrobacterium sp. ICMP 7243]KEA03583.1 hypothetical protein CN09_31405 [Rhizobium rhizogenes]MQB32960.1 hypothetical protein [Rhizobium rhizogenes]OCI93462.1 hypothetical protein A6U85_19860 [Agrobacterium sp. 13-626]OCJ20639.1 hypothetical protein A6U89_12580 [Agrobacterium sp. B133/95]